MESNELFKIGVTEISGKKDIETIQTGNRSGSIKVWHGESLTVKFQTAQISGELTFTKGVIDKKVDLYKRAYETILLIASNELIKKQ